MAVKQWSPGDVLTAADMNAWTVPLVAFKPSDTSRTSTTTVTADPDLTLAVAANVLYEFFCYLDFEGGTSGASDIKWSFTVPAGTTLRYQALYASTSGISILAAAAGATNTGSTVLAAATNGAGQLEAASMWGTLDTAGTTGNLVLQWAQNTSSGTSTIVHAQSMMRLQRVG